MNRRNKRLENKLAAAIAVAGITAAAGASASGSGGNYPPRGANVDRLAGNCRIGQFEQTSKAGPYNALCEVMQDSEKCLALVKGQFHVQGTDVTVEPFTFGVEKARYCLEVLKRDLGLGTED